MTRKIASLLLAIATLSAASAKALAASTATCATDPAAIVAIEWIPRSAHRIIMKHFEAGLAESSDPAAACPAIECINVFSDEEKLDAVLSDVSLKPPSILIGFGDHVCRKARDKCPEIPLIALLARDPTLIDELDEDNEAAPVLLCITEPQPELVWRVARELHPNVKRLAIIYTEGFSPNERLADNLARFGKENDLHCLRTTVAAGFCRTDSDFERSLDKLTAAGGFDVLYVPDDPNCSRFGVQIYSYTRERGLPAIGSEATIGKGCSAAVALDYRAIGARAASLCADLLRKREAPTQPVMIDNELIIDIEAQKGLGRIFSPWLLENATPMR